MSYFTPLTGLLGGTSIGKSSLGKKRRHAPGRDGGVGRDPRSRHHTLPRNNKTVSSPSELLLVSHMILSPLLFTQDFLPPPCS